MTMLAGRYFTLVMAVWAMVGVVGDTLPVVDASFVGDDVSTVSDKGTRDVTDDKGARDVVGDDVSTITPGVVHVEEVIVMHLSGMFTPHGSNFTGLSLQTTAVTRRHCLMRFVVLAVTENKAHIQIAKLSIINQIHDSN